MPSVRSPQARFERVTISSYFAPRACSTPRRFRIARTARVGVPQHDLEALDVAGDIPRGEFVVRAFGDGTGALEVAQRLARVLLPSAPVSRGSSDERWDACVRHSELRRGAVERDRAQHVEDLHEHVVVAARLGERDRAVGQRRDCCRSRRGRAGSRCGCAARTRRRRDRRSPPAAAAPDRPWRWRRNSVPGNRRAPRARRRRAAARPACILALPRLCAAASSSRIASA